MTTEDPGVSAHERRVMSNFESWFALWSSDILPVRAATVKGAAKAAWDCQQATIDRLMLEHCPDEMTPEQLAEWERSQREGKHREFMRISRIAAERGSGT